MLSRRHLLLLLLAPLLWVAACRAQPQRLALATTTSTYDSGLLDAILPDFEQKYHARVDVVAVGTGQALALGEAGDVDVVLVHAREQEDAFVAEGHGLARYDVMYNDFILLGPPEDPAGIAGMGDVVAALGQIAARQALFVSRGDQSGTHIREQQLWQAAGITPGGDWYQSVGQGMGATLTVAGEEGAYTLSDRGTYVARLPEGLGLEIMVQGDERLFNPYGVIPLNPARHPSVNAGLAQDFVTWLTSEETQAAIGAFRVNGQQLFSPNAHPPES